MLYKIESCSLEKNSTLRPCFMQFIESKLHFHLRINNVMTAILKSFFFFKKSKLEESDRTDLSRETLEG